MIKRRERQVSELVYFKKEYVRDLEDLVDRLKEEIKQLKEELAKTKEDLYEKEYNEVIRSHDY